ncbi:DUF1043 family protein [Thalassotalea ponticola]|uniref:ZapG family protein n=1 Tax=Thalassotalea ponticola TaxID=1523392 RepID=UPI0025B372CE|nr:DUF1043 family protein [Thalassotalea ponticola]MDN3653531.1 DUF1043 family protein [Thalassotalea ponticola]
MEIVYLLVGITIGAIGGFIARKQMSASEQQLQRLQQQVNDSQTSLEQYQSDVATHLKNSTSLLARMNEACQAAMVQMEQSTDLLDRANQRSNDMPFFSAEAQEYMRNSAANKGNKRTAQRESLTEAPRDYANDRSGLFSEAQQNVTNKAS